MPEVQDVFRMATQGVGPEPDFVGRHYDRKSRRTRDRRWGALTLVAVLAAISALVAVRLAGDDSKGEPAQPSPTGFTEPGVYSVDLITGTGARIMPRTASRVDVSPDGSWIAFEKGRQIYVANPDGSEAHRVTNDPDGVMQANWSPDGRRLAYVKFASGGTGAEVFVLDLATGETQQVTHVGSSPISNPSWSPDGRAIVFTTHVRVPFSDEGGPILRSVDVSTGVVTRLTGRTDGAVDAAWSRDGSTIAFASDEVGRTLDDVHGIFLMDPDGSNVRALVSAVAAWFPTWSPDGTRVAYFAEEGGVCCSTYVVDVASGDVRKVAEKGLYTDWLDDHTLVIQACPSCR